MGSYLILIIILVICFSCFRPDERRDTETIFILLDPLLTSSFHLLRKTKWVSILRRTNCSRPTYVETINRKRRSHLAEWFSEPCSILSRSVLIFSLTYNYRPHDQNSNEIIRVFWPLHVRLIQTIGCNKFTVNTYFISWLIQHSFLICLPVLGSTVNSCE